MTTYASVAARMRTTIDAWEQHRDGRCVFLRCYAAMTDGMLRGLEDCCFSDGPWVAELVTHFASYYFNALDAYDALAPSVPAVWARTFDLACGKTTTVLQDLLLGINAHINHDLALAVADLLTPHWPTLSVADQNMRHADYLMVNDVIVETIDSVQSDVAQRYARLLGVLDFAAGPLDEWGTAYLIQEWRGETWDSALALMAAPDTDAREAVRSAIEARALRYAEAICAADIGQHQHIGYPIRALRRLRLL